MDENESEEVAHLLRDKVRSHALDLLSRIDSISTNRSRTTTAAASESHSPPQTASSSTSSSPTPQQDEAANAVGESSAATASSSSNQPQFKSSSLQAHLQSPPQTEAKPINHDLTRKMQKLAQVRDERSKKLCVIQADTSSHLTSAKTFSELNLPKHIRDAIYTMGFNRPSTIQAEALPRIVKGRNLIGQSQSGSGKTIAFSIGLLYRLLVDAPATTQALCVTPTRELAIQVVEKAIKPLAVNMPGLKVKLAVAGETINKGEKVDAHLVVGTPGKVVDWIKRKLIDPRTVRVFVVDEADNMVDQAGFRANMLLIKKRVPRDCQTLLFSATFPAHVVEFTMKMVVRADKILFEEDRPDLLMLDVIKQVSVDTRKYGKILFLADIYNLMTAGQSIIFVDSREEADLVSETLSSAGYTCSVLHSRMQSQERDDIMQGFRDGKSTILITTNVLSRGVDVVSVCLVVNYTIPMNKEGEPAFETYLHRIGRTGRFGRKGTAINLVGDDKSAKALAAIQAHYSAEITAIDADPEALAETIEI